jgi:hypothetical protein
MPSAEHGLHCSWRARTTEFVCGELDGPAGRRFEVHLLTCDACRADVRELQETLALLRRGDLEPAEESFGDDSDGTDPSLPERVLAQIPAGDWRRARRARRWVPALIGAAASLAAAAMLAAALLRPAQRTVEFVEHRDAAPIPTPLSDDSADAVNELALAREWLEATQETDGSWSPKRWGGDPAYRVGLTALAALVLLGAGDDGATAAETRAAEWLVGKQRDDGRLGDPFRGALYNHAIGTLALVEATAERPADARLAGAADRALAFLIETQTARGAWGYAGDGLTLESDSIAVWALQALVRARSHGRLRDCLAIERGRGWFATGEGAGGFPSAAYREAEGHICAGSRSSSPLRALALVLAGECRGSEAEARAAVDTLVRLSAARTERPTSFYEVFFVLESLKLCGHPALQDCRRRTEETLIASQVRKGPLRGSWEPTDRWSPVGGRLYTTAMAALALKKG